MVMNMKNHASPGRALSLLTALALLLSLCVLPASAEEAGGAPEASFVNTSGDGGEDFIALCESRTFQAMVPVDLTLEEAQAAAETAVWSLDYDEALTYVDPELYPNHTQGGPLDTWTLKDGTGNLFTDVLSGPVRLVRPDRHLQRDRAGRGERRQDHPL